MCSEIISFSVYLNMQLFHLNAYFVKFNAVSNAYLYPVMGLVLPFNSREK